MIFYWIPLYCLWMFGEVQSWVSLILHCLSLVGLTSDKAELVVLLQACWMLSLCLHYFLLVEVKSSSFVIHFVVYSLASSDLLERSLQRQS